MTDAESHPPEIPWFVHRDIVAARRDPRLDHGRKAIIADWWAACEAAERARRLAEWGLYELQQAVSREEQRTGFRVGDPDAPAEVRHELKATWERTHLAIAESANQMAEINAMTLVVLVGALDAMVEKLTPDARELRLGLVAEQMLRRAAERVSHERREAMPLDADVWSKLRKVVVDLLRERLPEGEQLFGTGALRWERVLKGAGLDDPPDRPVPKDLDEALTEVVALRHVIAHRASRVDARAKRSAPSLRYQEGDLVRIGREDYRRFAAALRTYADEVIRRFMLPIAEIDVDLADWRTNLPLNT